MPFFENLAEGLSRAAGANDTADAIEKKKTDRLATQHEELEGKTKGILDDVKTLQQRRASLPAGDPGIAEIDKALTAHQQAFRDLYHPIKNPGNLQKLGGFLQKHLTGKAPKPAPQSNEVTPERMAGLEASAAGTQPTDPYLTPDQLKQKARIAAGIDPRAGTDKPDVENWVPHDVTMADGTVQTLQNNTKSGKWTDLNGNPVPPERLSGAKVQPKAGAALKVGSFGEFLQQAYGANPTADQIEDGRKRWAQAASGTTVGEHVIQVPQPDGSIKAFTVQTTSHKEFGAPQGSGRVTPPFTPPTQSEGLKVPGNIPLGGRPILNNSDGSISSERSFSIGTDQGEVLIPRVFDGKDHTEQEAIAHYKQTGQHMGIFDTPAHADAYAEAIHNRSIPRTPGQAKQRVAHAGIVGGGQTVGGKLTGAQTDAQKKYYDAVKLSSQADQVAQNPNDAVNQKRLAVALERAAAGRFTTQALDYIIKAGWGNTLEQWANNPSTGALPTDVMRQLVDGAHQNLTASKAALDEAMKGQGATPTAPASTQSSGKAVSFAKARQLPAMKGKSDDEIRAAIKAAGHEVAP